MESLQNQIGKKIYDLRKYIHLSQKNLAEGICTQALISKLEKGQLTPASDILYALSKRLGVDMNYFFINIDSYQENYMKDVYSTVQSAVNQKDYKTVHDIISNEMAGPLFHKILHYKQFILWSQALCIAYLDKNPQKAISHLDKAIYLTNKTEKTFDEQGIKILMSKGILLAELKKYEEAVHVFESAHLQLNSLQNLKDVKIFIRNCYNLAKVYTFILDYKKSHTYCSKGINLCKEEGYIRYLPELYFQRGLNDIELKQLQAAQKSFLKAHQIYELMDHTNYKDMCTKKLTLINNLLQQKH